jgi:hypothetical protein
MKREREREMRVDQDATKPLFVMPPVIFRTVNYVRLTVPAVRAMFSTGTFPGGVAAHLPLRTYMRLEVDGELRPDSHDVDLCDTGSSSVSVALLPFKEVAGKRRLGIRRMNCTTLVLVLASVAPPVAPPVAQPEPAVAQPEPAVAPAPAVAQPEPAVAPAPAVAQPAPPVAQPEPAQQGAAA